VDTVFILVEPKRAENVGAAARALKTMGFSQLRLVGEALHKTQGARTLAHGAGELLASVKCYGSLKAATTDIDFVIGTSAKLRHHRRYHHKPEELAELLLQKHGAIQRAAIVFGREDHGLSNTEIRLCDALSQVPMATPYPSLNLGQAVMLYSYTLATLAAPEPDQAHHAQAGQYRALKPKIQQLLNAAGIASDEKTHLWAMERLAEAKAEDIGFLHFICDKLKQR
jgi:tRNA/rRNA methyltransferase